MFKNHEEPKNFIDKNFILSFLTQEEIFSIIFNFLPKEFDYCVSPFRADKNPGCFFHYYGGKLRFVDFGNSGRYLNIRMTSIDCFDAITVHKQFTSFHCTLEFLSDYILTTKKISLSKEAKTKLISKPKKLKEIFIKPRGWDSRDPIFWAEYGISKKNLVEDKVFPVQSFTITNTKSGTITIYPKDASYAYTGFQYNHKKIYRPYNTGKYRFMTNCTENDIGGIEFLDYSVKHLTITKSYKDYRVLKNLGYNVIWFQNEGMIPKKEVLEEIILCYTTIYIFFDNDVQGIKASDDVTTVLEGWFIGQNFKQLHVPEKYIEKKVSDPSDMYKEIGKKELQEFLKLNIIT